MATFKDLLDHYAGRSGWSIKNNEIYITTSNQYIDTDMFPRSIIKDACEEAYEYWKRDEEDTTRMYRNWLNAKYGCKEKETNDMEKLRIIEQELMEMAKRYDLGLKKEYNYAVDELKFTFDKDTCWGWKHEHMVVTKVRTRDVRETLERIEHRIVKVFNIDLSKLDVVIPAIKNVIHNDPATIVFWADNSKTVVKCQEGDIYDPEKGLAMAIAKKALGNRGNYCNAMKKWLPEEDKTVVELAIGSPELKASAFKAAEAVKKVTLKAADIGAVLRKGKDE